VPDFDRNDLEAAVQEFHRRERRFGGLISAETQPARSNIKPNIFSMLLDGKSSSRCGT
jgi:hypothetical protein